MSAATMESSQPQQPHWSPQLVEDLLFRRFIRREEVRPPPPPPAPSCNGPTENYDRSTKMLFHYVRNGPLAALAAQNVNTSHIGGKASSVSPSASTPATSKARSYHHHIPLGGAAATSATAGRPPSSAIDPSSSGTTRPLTSRANTPVHKTTATASSSRAPSPSPKPSTSAAGGLTPPPPAQKRARIEWPSGVPSNKSLCSSSRSKVQHLTAARVAAQENVDPDLIFQQNSGELPLHEIFAAFPNSLKAIKAVRNASGDWRQDTFTPEEEGLYKKELGYRYIGPSQCAM